MELGQKRSQGNIVMDLGQKNRAKKVGAKKEPWQHGGGEKRKELGQKDRATWMWGKKEPGQHGAGGKK